MDNPDCSSQSSHSSSHRPPCLPSLPPPLASSRPPPLPTSSGGMATLPLTPQSGSFLHLRRPSKPTLPPLACISNNASAPTTPAHPPYSASSNPSGHSYSSQSRPTHHASSPATRSRPHLAASAGRLSQPNTPPYPSHESGHYTPSSALRTAPLFPANSPVTPSYHHSASMPNTPGAYPPHSGPGLPPTPSTSAPGHHNGSGMLGYSRSSYPPHSATASGYPLRRHSPIPEDSMASIGTLPKSPAPGLYDDQVSKFRVRTIDGHPLADQSLKHSSDLQKIYETCDELIKFARFYSESHNRTERQPTFEQVDEMVRRSSEVFHIFTEFRKDITRPAHEDEAMQYIRNKRTNLTPTNNRSRKRNRKTNAAAPGKCHSCSISVTPEWRRGPDGARTLCNACGLHYAKLTKKRQQEHALMLKNAGMKLPNNKASSGGDANGESGNDALSEGMDSQEAAALAATYPIPPVTMEEVKAAAHGDRMNHHNKHGGFHSGAAPMGGIPQHPSPTHPGMAYGHPSPRGPVSPRTHFHPYLRETSNGSVDYPGGSPSNRRSSDSETGPESYYAAPPSHTAYPSHHHPHPSHHLPSPYANAPSSAPANGFIPSGSSSHYRSLPPTSTSPGLPSLPSPRLHAVAQASNEPNSMALLASASMSACTLSPAMPTSHSPLPLHSAASPSVSHSGLMIKAEGAPIHHYPLTSAP
ncbi:hypothetical protein H4R33_001117 [Dimargaris cristalligena]|nr:hypothetical protein H4R33_001117 [Dimargaris cristalligena]